MLVCLYEDRPYQVAGLKILLLSLESHCPSWPVRLRFPGVSDAFRQWLGRFRQLTLREEPLLLSGSYNVKPAVLLDGLASGASECLWLDTDVLVNGSLDFIGDIPAETIVVTQDPWEYADGSTHRSRTWGMEAGRSLPGPINSSVVRITGHHRSLLTSWQSVLSTDSYLAEQAKPVSLRDRHILSDQDALSALLASEEFSSIPVRRLLHSSEILQHHGAGAYGLKQRLETLRFGLPPLIHAMGTVKPWKMPRKPSLVNQTRDYYERVYLELSPYVHLARRYREQLQEECDWLTTQTLVGHLSSFATLNRPAFKGALQASLHNMVSRR